MEEMELTSFEIISHVGAAKSYIMQGLSAGRLGDFTKVDHLLEEATKELSLGHAQHVNLIQKEADGHKTEFSLLFMHAEDQFMTTYLMRDMAYELIEMWKEIKGVGANQPEK